MSLEQPGADDALQTNAADEAQVAHARRKTKERKRRAYRLMRQQLSTPDGREFVWNELQEHGLYADAYGNAEAVFAFLGRRREGLRLLGEVMKHPRLYLEMQREAFERDARDAAENEASRVNPRDAAQTE